MKKELRNLHLIIDKDLKGRTYGFLRSLPLIREKFSIYDHTFYYSYYKNNPIFDLNSFTIEYILIKNGKMKRKRDGKFTKIKSNDFHKMCHYVTQSQEERNFDQNGIGNQENDVAAFLFQLAIFYPEKEVYLVVDTPDFYINANSVQFRSDRSIQEHFYLPSPITYDVMLEEYIKDNFNNDLNLIHLTKNLFFIKAVKQYLELRGAYPRKFTDLFKMENFQGKKYIIWDLIEKLLSKYCVLRDSSDEEVNLNDMLNAWLKPFLEKDYKARTIRTISNFFNRINCDLNVLNKKKLRVE